MEKIDVAKNCYFIGSNLSFETEDIQEYPLEKYDCILFSDVLHYLPLIKQVDVLKRSMKELNPGGSIIIRDGDASKDKRQRNTRLTEWFSTKVFRFNQTRNDLSFFRADEILSLAGECGFKGEIIDNTRFTSNILIILTRK